MSPQPVTEAPESPATADAYAALGVLDLLDLPPSEVWNRLTPATRFWWIHRAKPLFWKLGDPVGPRAMSFMAWDSLPAHAQKELRQEMRRMLGWLAIVHAELRG